MLNYIEVSTPHTYWLARSFVLLADVYMKLGRNLDAKQYLLSLKQNYQADDDIAGMIESRLNKLNAEKLKIMKKNSNYSVCGLVASVGCICTARQYFEPHCGSGE